MKPTLGVCAAFVAVCIVLRLVSPASADTFGSGGDAFEIEFVRIGQPGNPPDDTGQPRPAGSVPYEYRIAKYEVSERMIDAANALSAAAGSPLNITHDGRGPNKPATSRGQPFAGKFPDTKGFFDPVNRIRVIINSQTGDVVTVIPGGP